MKSNSERITVDLSNELHENLKNYSDKYEMSKSAAVRSILAKDLKEGGKA